MKGFFIGLLSGVLLGGIAAGMYVDQAKNTEIASVALIDDIYRINMAARSLSLLDENRIDILRHVTLMELQNGVNASYRLITSEKPYVGKTMPNLMRGFDDAERHLESSEQAYLVAWLQDVTDYVTDNIDGK